MPVAAVLTRAVHQALDLALGEIASLDCQVYDAWGVFLGHRFHADKPSLKGNDCLADVPLLNSQSPMEKLPARPPDDRPRDPLKRLAKGILKVAKSLGIRTGTVQRISKERAM